MVGLSSAGTTPPRPPAATHNSPALRPSPAKPGGSGLGLPLGDRVFGSSWGSMGSGVGVGNANAASSAADATGLGGEGDTSAGGLWGTLGMDVGGTVPPSGQAIWGSSSLLDSALSGGVGAGGDSMSLLLAPSTGSAVQATVDTPSMSTFASPLDLSPWGGGGGGRGVGGVGATAGDEFAGSLSSSLGDLQLGVSENKMVRSKSGGQQQQQQRDLFGAGTSSGDSTGGLSWG